MMPLNRGRPPRFYESVESTRHSTNGKVSRSAGSGKNDGSPSGPEAPPTRLETDGFGRMAAIAPGRRRDRPQRQSRRIRGRSAWKASPCRQSRGQSGSRGECPQRQSRRRTPGSTWRTSGSLPSSPGPGEEDRQGRQSTQTRALRNMRIQPASSCHSSGRQEFCTARNTRSGCGIMMVTRPSRLVRPVMPRGEPLGLAG